MNLPFTLPFTLPDWLPTWAFLLLALPILLYLLVFLIMPFSVFGVKARLENLEQQLESIQEDLRYIANRNISRTTRPTEDDDYDIPNFSRMKSGRTTDPQPQPTYKPIPPAPLTPAIDPRDKLTRLPQRPPRRTEPRLD
jgi:hypothetical protein